MQKVDLTRLHRMAAHCQNIYKTLQNMTHDAFRHEENVDARDVCAFRLFQIGEHAHKLSDDAKADYPDFKWNAAYRFRNVLGHDYEGVSYNAIWKSCKNDIPLLHGYVKRILEMEAEIEAEMEAQAEAEASQLPTNPAPAGHI